MFGENHSLKNPIYPMSGLLFCFVFNSNYYQNLPHRCIAAYTDLSHRTIIGGESLATSLEGSDPCSESQAGIS